MYKRRIDIDDAERAGILKEEDIPLMFRQAMGFSTRERLNTLIHAVIDGSRDIDDIAMTPKMEELMMELRAFMFKNVYQNPSAKGEEKKAIAMLQRLYEYYLSHTDTMPEEYIRLIRDAGEPAERVVCDYISGMTDQYSVQKFSDLFVPGSWLPD